MKLNAARELRTLLILGAFIALVGCGGGGDSSAGGAPPAPQAPPSPPSPPAPPIPPEPPAPSAPTFIIGGTVSGLTGTVVLQNNGGDDLTVVAAGAFRFRTPLLNGDAYAVTVLRQPVGPAQTCTVANANGVVAGADITTPVVNCVTQPTPTLAYVADWLAGSISVYAIDDTTGALESRGHAPVGPQFAGPDAVTIDPSGRFLYAVGIGNSDRVMAFTIDRSSGALTHVGDAHVGGELPSSIAADPSGRFVYVANFAFDGSVSAFSIEPTTGALETIEDEPIGGGQQNGINPFSITIDPAGEFVYVAPYLHPQISCFAINTADGSLSRRNPRLDTGQIVAIAMDPKGKVLYAASLDDTNVDSISAYRIGPDGTLGERVGNAVKPGTMPASIAVDPSGEFLYVGAEDGQVFAVAIDPATGAPAEITGDFDVGENASSVTVHPSGGFVFVTDITTDEISTLARDPTSGILTRVSLHKGRAGPFSMAILKGMSADEQSATGQAVMSH